MHGGASSERGGIVLGWLTRVVVILAVVAIIAFDVVAIATARLGTSDDANAAAGGGERRLVGNPRQRAGGVQRGFPTPKVTTKPAPRTSSRCRRPASST